MKKLFLGLTVGAMAHCSLSAMNLLRPWDTLVRPPLDQSRALQVAIFGEYGFAARGYNNNGERVNPLAIWDCTESTLAMIKGFPAGSPQGQLAARLSTAFDDGTRGHVELRGDMMQASWAATMRAYFAKDWSLLVSLPFHHMSLKNVSVCDKTLSITEDDDDVKELLTNKLAQNVCTLGDDLSLGSWERTGLGDTVLLVEWTHDFEQAKTFLKNVRVNWRFGGTIPSGKAWDADKLMGLPFGADGSASIIAGFGLDLSYGTYFKAGGDVELQQPFGTTRCRRIKTDSSQTNLLLLEKVSAYKDCGMIQRFNLYCQFYEFLGGLSLKIGYQYLKHGDDYLNLNTLDYADAVAYTARPLFDWTLHQGVFVADYNIGKHFDHDAVCLPRVSLFSRLPFNGKRAIASPILGAMFSLDF